MTARTRAPRRLEDAAADTLQGPLEAVLFDRDATLVVDVPYNGDPDLVVPMPTALEAVRAVRAAGLATGVVTNQSGIGRGLVRREQVDAVNRRVDDLFGGLGTWHLCPHTADDGCPCRKPRPGMVLAAAEALGTHPSRTAVVGDIGADVEAARAAGARAVLVPTPRTLGDEVRRAPVVAATLLDAVETLLASASRLAPPTGRRVS